MITIVATLIYYIQAQYEIIISTAAPVTFSPLSSALVLQGCFVGRLTGYAPVPAGRRHSQGRQRQRRHRPQGVALSGAIELVARLHRGAELRERGC